MLITNSTIFCERAQEGLKRLEFDMEKPFAAERRVPEIALVNPHTAPELLALFIEAYVIVGSYFAQLELELETVYNYSRRRAAIVTLDDAPNILKEKGFTSARSPTGSEDSRRSVVDVDSEYNALQDKIPSLKATKTFMAMKLEVMDKAYNAVKKMMDRNQQIGGPRFNNSVGEDEVVGQPVVESSIRGFGKARY